MDDNAELFLKITENRSRIMATVVAMTRDFNVAEDLFQETVLEVMKSAQRFDSTRDFAPWACAIARNVVRRHWRRQEKQPVAIAQDALDSLAEIAADDPDPEHWQEERLALRKCLEKIPERMRKLVVLRYGHNCKGQELARRALMKPGSLRTTLLRLRQKLRNCVSGEIDQKVDVGY